PAHATEGLHQPAAENRVRTRPRGGRHRVQSPSRLVQVAALLPEPPYGERQPDRGRRVAGRGRPIEDGSDVVMLAIELIEEAALLDTRQLRGEALAEVEEPARVARRDLSRLAALREHFAGEG